MREKAFQFINICCTVCIIFVALIIVLTRNEPYSIYFYIRSDYNCLTSLLSFLLCLCLVIIEQWDLGMTVMLVFDTIYLSCFSMQYWLQKIWYVVIVTCHIKNIFHILGMSRFPKFSISRF